MRRANYVIVEDDFTQEQPLIIKDVGPWDRHPTVTNVAEDVVAELINSGHLPPGRVLWCYDSEGTLDELKVKDGKFDGFAPGPRE
jgi:hypothetical protein